MNIAIIGAGFTGLSAGYYLTKAGHKVTIFEKENFVGGLSAGFKEKDWDWSAEKFYHHIFTNDTIAINLAKSLGIKPLFSHPTTSVYWENNIYPFNGALDLLCFPGLSPIDKIRMGTTLASFKLIPNGRFLESLTVRKSLTSLMGQKGFSAIWEPLLISKFHKYASEINLAWFWARIKKRTSSLGTFSGGFQVFADCLATEIMRSGGKISLNSPIRQLADLIFRFDLVLSTSTQQFSNVTMKPSVSYLTSHVLLLEMSTPFLKDVYWLNILDHSLPFLVTAEHTNFVNKKHFDNTHLLYIGNYLPEYHPLLSLSLSQVFLKYLPHLQQINPDFSEKQIIKKYLFIAPDAQPIVTVNYSHQIPALKQNAKLFVANQSMIYPWDRGVNYSIELGRRAALEILK